MVCMKIQSTNNNNKSLLLLLLLLLLLQVRPEIINNYISHKKVDIRQRHKMMAEKGNF